MNSARLLSILVALVLPVAPLLAGAQEPPVESIARVTVDRDGDTIPDRKGEQVRVRGVVTLPTGLLRTRGLHTIIQDDGGGIGLYSPDLEVRLDPGDRVEATGRLSQFKGAIQLEDAVVRRIAQGTAPPAAAVSTAEADSWKHMGRHVRIEGLTGPLQLDGFGLLQLTGKDGSVVTLFIPATITRQFDWKRYARGTRVAATGVLSIYKPAWPYDDGFQLVLASPSHLQVLAPPRPAWLDWATWVIAGAALVIVLSLLVFQLMQHRKAARDRELKTLAALSSAFEIPGLAGHQLARRACEILTVYGIVEAVAVQGFDSHGSLRQLATSSRDPETGALLESAGDTGEPRPGDDPDGRQLAARMAAAHGLEVLAVHPLLAPSGALGFLVALSPRRRRPTQVQERTLLSAVKLLAMALENTRIQQRARIEQQELQQLVITDGLTGLHNRRFLDEYLRVQIPLAQRNGSGLAFLAIDIDHFKQINDSHGHEAGDRVLVGIAAQLRQAGRRCDIPVRLGGEEFLFVIAEHGVEGALAFAERLRSEVAAHRFAPIGGKPLQVTLSIGVAVFGLHGTDAATLLRASDEAMYASKHGGRNRVTLSGTAPAQQPGPEYLTCD